MYIGRFAPSPTGPLHFGSLLAAMGSYLDARKQGGLWLLRIEDIDPPREQPGASDNILRTLEHYGFEWDREILYQSQHHEAYRDALQTLSNSGKLYECICSRKQISDANKNNSVTSVYPGTCRERQGEHHDRPYSVRIRIDTETVTFNDLIQGHYGQNLIKEVGDFNLLRRDGFFSYHLAVVVDDALQGITRVMRGHDLLDSTPRQIYLQQQLSLPTPEYAHLPIAINAMGQKLSKQTFAKAIGSDNTGKTLWQALSFLGQQPPEILSKAPVQEIWQWASTHWDLKNVPRQTEIFYKEQ